MKRIETSVVIRRPVDQVFAYVIDPANLPDWVPGYLEATSTSEPPIRVGSTSTRITNFGGRRAETHHIVSEFEPNARIAFITKSGPLKIKELVEVDAIEGGTQVTIAEEVTAPLLAKPAEWFFARKAGQNIGKFGLALKNRLEGSS